MQLTSIHLTSLIVTLLVVVLIGIYSGRKVKSATDFSVGGRKAGSFLVAATIMGTLVGGASTIGTAQLAFEYGLSAWWFTLGAGMGCLLLAFLARPLREGCYETVPELLAGVYGGQAQTAASVFSSIGTFLNLVGQLLAAVALLTSMLGISPWQAALVAAVLIIFYVVFGGVWGASLVGLTKLILLYSIAIIAGVQAYGLSGGWQQLQNSLPAFPWFSLFGRGFTADLAAGFALIVGVLSTQTYIQAVFSGRDAGASRRGALLAAFLIPPAGIPGILIGLHMRLNFSALPPGQAFPAFVLTYLPPWLGGIALATLLIVVVGTGAGLALGISTMLTRDIYSYFSGNSEGGKNLLVLRLLIIGVTLASLGVVLSGNVGSIILEWSYLSMGLRGATICLPLIAALFCPHRISPGAGKLAIILGPATVIAWEVGGGTVDPLYPGLAVSLVTLAAGVLGRKIKARHEK